MPRLTRPALFCLLALTLIHPAGAVADDTGLVEWAIGAVRNGDDGQLLYHEHHLAPSRDALPTRVVYRAPDDEVFAEKSLDHSQSTEAPAMDFRDHRRDVRIVTYYPEDAGGDEIEMLYQEEGNGEPRRQRFDTDSLIVDAGFDPFVRERWQRLVDESQRIVANFLVPSRNDTVRIGIEQVRRDRCETDRGNLLCFEVGAAGALRLVSWFIDPIRLGYDAETRRLVFYHGRGNIPDASGEQRSIRIDYRYE